jgi:F-type H+-transporting ATPase subunit b
MNFDASFFVALSFALVILGFIRLKLPSKVIAMLDARAAEIKQELDEAQALRDEAMAVLADYKKRADEAEAEAEAIITQAKEDAVQMAKDAKIAMENRLERRTLQAEDKIARAEAQLIQDVRAAAADLAVSAASRVIEKSLKKADSAKLIKNSIDNIGKSLH